MNNDINIGTITNEGYRTVRLTISETGMLLNVGITKQKLQIVNLQLFMLAELEEDGIALLKNYIRGYLKNLPKRMELIHYAFDLVIPQI